MASLNSYISHVTGTTGLVNTIEPKAGWKAYLFPRGAHAAAASAASPITFDSTQAAARFSALDWFQVGTDTSTIRQISAVAGTSFTYSGSAVTVAQNARILRIGSTQPVVTSSNAEYQPHTTTYPRDDDGGTPNGSSSVTDANGQYQFFASDALYDILIQDSNGANRGIVPDAQIGFQVINDLTPVTSGGASLGTCSLPFANLRFVGMLDSGITAASGRTAFKFDTCNAITAGNLFSFGNTGSVKVYGDTHGGIFQSWTLPEVRNVKSAKYGAKGDGTTDDTTAIANALSDAYGSDASNDGGTVYLPRGTYIVNSPLLVRQRVRLLGEGDRSSTIKAGGAFSFTGVTTAVVVLGPYSSEDSQSARIERLGVDCNGVANSINVYSQNVQEGGGIYDCLLAGGVSAGVYFRTSGCQNFGIYRCTVTTATSATGANGIVLDQVGVRSTIDDCTINTNDTGTISTGSAILIANGGHVAIKRFHVERFANGVYFADTNTGGTVELLHSHDTTTVDYPVRINTNGVLVTSASPAGSTNTIRDDIHGVTFAQNGGGWYWHSNDGGAYPSKSIFTSTQNVQSRLMSPTLFGRTVTLDGAFGVTGSAHFGGQISHDIDSVTGSTDTVSVTNRSTILLSGSTNIGTLSGGVAGQRVRFICAAGAAPIFTKGNTLSLTAATITLGPNDFIDFTALTGGVSWIQSGYQDNGTFT